MLSIFQKGIDIDKANTRNAHKARESSFKADKGEFSVIGNNNITQNGLNDLRKSGSAGLGGMGQEVKLSKQDEERGQRVLEEYVFNIVASNKVIMSLDMYMHTRILRLYHFTPNHTSFDLDIGSSNSAGPSAKWVPDF